MTEHIHRNDPIPETRRQERIPTAIEKVRGYLATEQIKLARRFETMQTEVPAERRLTLASDFRLVPPPSLYGPTEKEFDAGRALEHYGTLEKDKIRAAEDKSAGTQFEILKTAVMHKHAGNRFIVVRSSRYDDSKNGVDNVLVDTTNGQTICAFDEVNASFHGKALVEKTNTVLSKNFGIDLATESKFGVEQKTGEKGVQLKYGIKIQDGKMECAELAHLPIFLLATDYDQLDEGQRTFINGGEKGLYETKMFKYFLTTLFAQIQQLKLKPKRYDALPQELRARVESFELYIQETLPKLKV